MKKFDINFPGKIRYFLEDIDFLQSSFVDAIKDLAQAVCSSSNCILWGCQNGEPGAILIDGEVCTFSGGQHNNKFSIKIDSDPNGARDGQNPRKIRSAIADAAGVEIKLRYDSLYVTSSAITSITNTIGNLTTSLQTTTDNLSTHTNSKDLHIQAGERTKWNSALIPVGCIEIWAGNIGSIPVNWMQCNGAELAIANYPELYAVVGALYGISQSPSSFKLPNLQQKFVAGYDSSHSDYNIVGKTGGKEKHALSAEENGQHTHDIPLDDGNDTQKGIFMNVNIQNDASYTKFFTTESSGLGKAHENRPPYMAMPYIIKVK